MYLKHFGLKEFPFSIAPNPRYLYMSEQHREALAHLIYGMKNDCGFVLLTGEVGTGKTTICRCMLEQLPENVDVAFVLNPKLSAIELLETICDELKIPYPKGTRSIKVFIDAINTYLLDAYSKGRNTILIIEEAQNLSDDVLEQLRLLTNLETNEKKLLQIILLGQPELRERLSKPELRQLSQRITARYHIRPLSKKEVYSYIKYRLAVAGAETQIFPPNTTGLIHSLSKGIPRLINIICDRALLGAYIYDKYTVNKKIIKKAAKEVLPNGSVKRQFSNAFKYLVSFLLLILSGLIILSLYHNKEDFFFINTTALSKLVKETTEPVDNMLKDNKLKSFINSPIEKNKEKAFQSLFKEWNISYQFEDGDECLFAESKGLGCLIGKGSLNNIIALNRPAVLKLHDDSGREFYTTLFSIEDNQAVLIIDDKYVAVDIKELGQYWSGDYIILWKKPLDFKTSLRPGEKGKLVKWLTEMLSIITKEKIEQNDNTVYDEKLIREVKKFQISKGLIPDGIVGPQTIIHINNMVGSDEPLLLKQKISY